MTEYVSFIIFDEMYFDKGKVMNLDCKNVTEKYDIFLFADFIQYTYNYIE